MLRGTSQELRGHLLSAIARGERGVVSRTAAAFAISRQAVHRHLQALTSDGILQIHGRGRGVQYELLELDKRSATFPLAKDLQEDEVYTQLVRPVVEPLEASARDVCYYGFTEMVNNAIDHSRGHALLVKAARTAGSIELLVHDDGVGIFAKIADALGLSDPRESLLELSKGKFTTDPERHTGEGIFFASRAFDAFAILSGDLFFNHRHERDDWLLEHADSVKGTSVMMTLLLPVKTPLEDVFARFSSGPDEYRFAKTHVPVRLAKYGDEQLISRSQAKRVLGRFDRFDEVMLDFDGVRTVGQAFADEIFRVFASQHPQVQLRVANDNPQIRAMIRRAQSAKAEQEKRRASDSPGT
jgi:hypothetical protein